MSVGIKESDIASIDECGMLDDSPVQMIRTTGGLWLMVGKPKKGSDTVLAAASHPAIARHQASKQFSGFKPHMMKSEGEIEVEVQDLTKSLTKEIQAEGYELYKMEENGTTSFTVSRNEIELSKFEVSKGVGCLKITPTITKALTGAEKTVAALILDMALKTNTDIVLNKR